MATCPHSGFCAFFRAVEPSLLKRIKYASSFPYCNSGKQESCALYPFLEGGHTPPSDMLPNGDLGEYAEEQSVGPGLEVIVLEDSAVFATLAAQAVVASLPGASVVRCDSYAEAATRLREGSCGLIVCGYGVGEGRTAHDVRRLTAAPMVILTGHAGREGDLPSGSHLVLKSAGPDALKAAIGTAVRG